MSALPITDRLYFRDPGLTTFDAEVIAHATWNGAPSVVLGASAFYPESGGQMADRGALLLDGATRAIADVQLDEHGVVHHVLVGDAPLPPIGARVHGEIDAPRRRLFRALHTAQHMLSRALADVARAETVSSRLGETACTIDVDVPGLSESKLADAAARVSAAIDEDRPVRAWFPTAEELATLPLRRAPKQSENIRVVSVEGFDVSPCGGTHVDRTSQIGLCWVRGMERYKGGTRITFSAGARARSELIAHADALTTMGRELVCPPLDAPAALARLRAQLVDVQGELGRARAIVARQLAADGAARAIDRVARVAIDEGGAELAKKVAAELTQKGALVAIVCARIEGGTHVIVARGPESSVDCNARLKAILAIGGGRGGGRPERAEGRLPEGADVDAALSS